MNRADFKYRIRHYLHFDLPMGEEEAWRLSSSPERVSRHSFYPLVGYTKEVVRYKKNEMGVKERSKKERDIKICSHGDAAIYSYYAQFLGERYECELNRRGLTKVVTAFRASGKSGTNIDCAAEVFDFIQGHRPCIALAFDISKFFDRLDHALLKTAWQSLIGETRLPEDHYKVFRSLTNFSWVQLEEVYTNLGISPHNPRRVVDGKHTRRLCLPGQFRTLIRDKKLLRRNPELGLNRGIPQGSPISALLSNVYMLDFDSELTAITSTLGGLYRRYCDDIIVVVPPAAKEAIKQAVITAAFVAKIEVHRDKTHEAEFHSGATVASKCLSYLGFTFDGQKVLLRSASLDRYYSKMRRGVSLARQCQRKANRKEAAKGQPLSGLRTRQLYVRYSYLFKRRTPSHHGKLPRKGGNFITYAYKAASKLNSPGIKRQIRIHWRKLQQEFHQPVRNQLRGP